MSGCDVRLHGSFALLLGALLVSPLAARDARAGAWVVASVAIVLLSVLHMELLRMVVLGRAGIATQELLLTPLAGIARIARTPESVRTAVAQAFGGVVGPASAWLCVAALLALDGVRAPRPVLLSGRLLAEIYWFNLVLALAQLVPLQPFGFGRLVSQVALLRGGGPTVLARHALRARAVFLLVAASGLFVHLGLTLAGLLAYVAATEEQRASASASARITGRFGRRY